MKKFLLIIPVSVLLFSCSGNNNNTYQDQEKTQKQIEAIEESSKSLDETIKSSEDEMKENQTEIDSLLNNI